MTDRHDSPAGRLPSVARELVGAAVLVVDQDLSVHRGISQLLGTASLHVTGVADAEAAMAQVERSFFSVMLVDIDTPTPGVGIGTIRRLRAASPTSMIIALAARRSFDDAVTAVRAGAIDIILKAPESVAYLNERVLEAVGRSVGKRQVDSVLVAVRAIHEEFLQKFMEAERRALDLADRMSGRDPSRTTTIDGLVVLVIDESAAFATALATAAPRGFTFLHATSGGEGIDRITSDKIHYAMVSDDLRDLPPSMVIAAARTQAPDTVVFAFRGPGAGGYVKLIETAGQRPILAPFEHATQLLNRLDEFAEAFRVRGRQRRYTQNFREKHYDFLRRYVELKTLIDQALEDDST